ncbi:MAG: DUF4126 family protein [Rubrobacter sp.]|nr:DUF4126 family protein [Rubrobacter sp.]
MAHTSSGGRAFKRAALLGAVAGVRSMTAPALLSRAASRGDVAGIGGTPFAALASPKVRRALALLAIGEAVGDKFPNAPDRTSIPGLMGRVGSGALVGAALFTSEGRKGTAGAAMGLLCAVLAAYPSYYLRVGATERLGARNWTAGLVEDALALSTGLLTLRGER